VDIGTVEADKESDGYRELSKVTKDISMGTTQAQAAVNIQNMEDTQRINAGNMEETLRIQREEAQRAQRLQTEGANFAAHQLDQQTRVGMAGAQALGNGGMAMGVGGGMNPGGMMAGMAMGGALGQGMAGMMGNMLNGAPVVPPLGGAAPPPLPVIAYSVAVNGQTTGPFDMNALAQMAAAGQLTAQTQVWKPGMAGWAAAGTVQELAQVFASAPPPPPPPPAP
jgi:hypothetical protein